MSEDFVDEDCIRALTDLPLITLIDAEKMAKRIQISSLSGNRAAAGQQVDQRKRDQWNFWKGRSVGLVPRGKQT
jgi:hypothetical protein